MKKSKKILFYAHNHTNYGATKSLLDLVFEFNQLKDCKVSIIITGPGDIAEILEAKNIEYHILNHKKWVYNKKIYDDKKSVIISKLWLFKNILERNLYNLSVLGRHLSLVRRINPSLIYVNTSVAPIGLICGFLLRKKTVWHLRETINNELTFSFFDSHYFIFKYFLKNVDLAIYNSYYLLNFYKAAKYPNSKVCYIGFHDYSSIKVYNSNFGNTKIRLGMVGRLCEQKGQLEIIKELSKLETDRFEVHLYGDGSPIYVKLLSDVVKNNNVVLHGFEKEIENIYTNIDFLVSNAKNESFGRVLIEANLFSKPVIALNSGASSELVEDGTNGFKYNDLHMFQLVLKKINKFSEKEYNNLCTSSRKHAVDNYSIHQSFKCIQNSISNILE
ncbi:MAG: hypothetical protein DSY77_02305 [Bacteroidetes bacterium]|nr:MAG: hypothetical protein DSY77_02305 [Bacteroidota bacterium]